MSFKASEGSHTPMDLKPMRARTLRASTPLRAAGMFLELFSRVGQRDPPSQQKKEHVRLISIAISNFVEKARWSLDLLEHNPKSPVYYTEDLHAPALHAFHTVKASNDRASQSPMVVMSDDRVIWGSDNILREFCSDDETINLYPTEVKDQIIALEEELGRSLGASVRCFGYYCLFDQSKKYYGVASQFLTPHCPKIESFLLSKLLDRGIAKNIMKVMNVTKASGEASEEEIRKVFIEMSARLNKNGGGYLMDTPSRQYGFTAADLTLGALSYLLVRPPEMQPFLVPECELPPRMIQLGKDIRETTAGKHVLKMYQKHRPKDNGTVTVKQVHQDRLPWLEIISGAAVVGAVLAALKLW